MFPTSTTLFTVCLFPVGLFIGAQAPCLSWLRDTNESYTKRNEREHFEEEKSKYAKYIQPRTNPRLEEARTKRQTKRGRPDLTSLICLESDADWFTMDLAAAQGRLNLIKSDYYLQKDWEEYEKLRRGHPKIHTDIGGTSPQRHRHGMVVGHSWRALVAAARFGHLDILEWFERKGRFMCDNTKEFMFDNTKEVAEAAKEGGHSHILEWINKTKVDRNGRMGCTELDLDALMIAMKTRWEPPHFSIKYRIRKKMENDQETN